MDEDSRCGPEDLGSLIETLITGIQIWWPDARRRRDQPGNCGSHRRASGVAGAGGG